MAVRRGMVKISRERCKGCLLCADACPKGSITVSEEPNEAGLYPVVFSGEECTGCGLCYLVCPEPGCITVYIEDEKDE